MLSCRSRILNSGACSPSNGCPALSNSSSIWRPWLPRVAQETQGYRRDIARFQIVVEKAKSGGFFIAWPQRVEARRVRAHHLPLRIPVSTPHRDEHGENAVGEHAQSLRCRSTQHGLALYRAKVGK